MSPNSKSPRGFRKLLYSLGVVIAGCGLLTQNGCGPPPGATVAEVLALHDQPRSAEQQDALATSGRALFLRHNCSNCHVTQGPPRGAPHLADLYTTTVTLTDGRVIQRDADYLARSILKPRDHVVAGYIQPMSNYSHLPAEDVATLIAYLEQLSPPSPEAPPEASSEASPMQPPATSDNHDRPADAPSVSHTRDH